MGGPLRRIWLPFDGGNWYHLERVCLSAPEANAQRPSIEMLGSNDNS